MANSYTLGSGILPIPEEKRARAKELVAEFEHRCEEDEELGYVPMDLTWEDKGLWLRHNESIDPAYTAELVEILVAELDLPPFSMEFAQTCARPILGTFGGCAFRVERGKQTAWLTTASITDM